MDWSVMRLFRVLSGLTLLFFALQLQAATEWNAAEYDLYAGDFSGDGKSDLLYVAKDVSKSSGIARSDASGPNIPFQTWPSDHLGIPWHSNLYRIVVEDFNGDGRSDLFLQRNSAGDHYLLFADANGKFTSIGQSISNSHLGLEWSTDQHRAHAGDFDGDGRADLFLQAATPTINNVVVFSNAAGVFPAGSPTQSWTDATWGAFKWSVRNSNVHVGDFNGDAFDDLLIQAKPHIVMIDYDIPIPVPTYPPNMNGLVHSVGGFLPFTQLGVQQWSRSAFGADWSPNVSNVLVGDFDGNGTTDVILQPRSGGSALLLPGSSTAGAFGAASTMASNVTWVSASYRLIAGNFDGGAAVGLYWQAQGSGGSNYFSNNVTGGSLSLSGHDPSSATGVVPATAVGRTVGSFSVSSSGSATYSIPIVVPPGVAGMQPELTLNYQSGSGNGLLGVGWSLGGFSEIARCGKTLVQDGTTDGVNLSTSDRFCLDGNKLRLTGGTYGAAGSTYGTEMETFSRVTANGAIGNGPVSFSVEAKSGLLYEYGVTADSRIEAINSALATTVHTWALNKVLDRHGNSMSITYHEDGAPKGSFRPAEIVYTANANTSLAGAFKVVFVWGDRSAQDVLTSYIGGGVIKETKRLDRIETQYNEPGVGWRLVRTYQLGYNTSSSTPQSRLSSIQECDRNGACLSPTTIGWQDGGKGWTGTDTASTSDATAMMEYSYAIDIDGDGREDLVYPQSVSGTVRWFYMRANAAGQFDMPVNTGIAAGNATNLEYAKAHPIDYFADGRTGLLATIPGYSTRQILRWNGSGLSLTNSNLTVALSGKEWIADFDGDARLDILYATYVSGTGYFYVQKNAGATSGTAQFLAAQQFHSVVAMGTISPFGGNSAGWLNRVLDFNGDGRADFIYSVTTVSNCNLICLYNTTWSVVTSTGSSFAPAQTWSCLTLGLQPCNLVPIVGDFNGDGRTDLISHTQDGPTISWYVMFGSGAGLTAPVVAALPSNFNPYGFSEDYDSDGKADLLYAPQATSGNWVVLRSNGETFESPVTINLASSTANNTIRSIDIDGDGLRDLGFKSTQYRVRRHNGQIPDLAKSITDGFGNSVLITYAPLTDSSIYTKGSSAVFPVVDVAGAMYVVKSHTASDGIGGTYTVSEKYAGLQVHLQGRGMLGFSTRESIDGRSGIRSRVVFRQDFPFVGTVAESTAGHPNNGPLISKVVNVVSQLSVQGGQYQERYLPYILTSTQTNYEVSLDPSINGEPIASVSTNTPIDNNGNPTTVTTTTVDLTGSGLSYSSSTSNTYDDASCAWRGFVTRQQVTNTVPIHGAQVRTVQYVRDPINAAACRVHQEIVEPSGAADVKVTTTLSYDAFGHPAGRTVSAANIEPRTSLTSYGTPGVFPVSVTESVTSTFNQSATKTYDYALGLPKTATDPNGLVMHYDYDGFGRLVRETRADGTKSEWAYGACNVGNGYCGDNRLRYQVTKRELDSASPGNVIRTEVQRFDAFGRSLYEESQALSGAYAVVATNYDNQGRVRQKSQPYFAGFPVNFTTFTYDLIGRPVQNERRISEVDAGTQTTKYAYRRLIHTQEDGNGKTTTKRLSAIGTVVEVIDAADGVTSYEYDAFGNLRKTTDPAGNQIVSNYNIRGFKTSTNDPDMGIWTYTYYPTGELWTQTDAKSQAVSFTYDRVSKPKTRVEPEGTTTFTYGESSAAKNVGKLQYVSSPGGYSESYVYDSVGRLQDATTNADGTSFVVTSAYNVASGFLESVTYPVSTAAVAGSRFKVKYEYEYGLLKRTRDFNAPSTVYWEQVATNAAGQTIDEVYGNTVRTYSAYDEITGVLNARTAGPLAQVQDLSYQWDKVGNLMQRKDLVIGATEDFTYDNINRLKTSKLNNVQNLNLTYYANGNIWTKSDVGTYVYPTQGTGAVRPHAVTTAGSNSYGYDSNGNMTVRNGSAITWYSYNYPNRINRGSNYSQFYYGADRSRYKQVSYTAPGGSLPEGTETTIYAGGLFERVTKPSGVVEYKHYVLAGREPIAIRTLRSNGANDTRYLHKDHLGSVDTITNETGGIVMRLSYDAFGKRRDAVDWTGPLDPSAWSSIAAVTHRAFTFHEQLDNVELVHMNGRVYDAGIGRFISADPFIQAPLMSQSLNRYSYAVNNPLSLVDPSGYSWLSKAWKKLRRHLTATLRLTLAISVSPSLGSARYLFDAARTAPGQDRVDRFVMTHKWAYAAGQIIATAATSWGGGFGGSMWASYYNYLGTGSMTEALRVGAINYASSYAFRTIGATYGYRWNAQRVVLEGAVGGVASELNGGRFSDGLLMGAGMSLLNWGAYEMRRAMVAQSKIESLNRSGVSDGMYGDDFKLAGTRVDQYGRSGLGVFGGRQGGAGMIFNQPYAPGSFADHLLEAYAGPHDWLSSFAYLPNGNIQMMSAFQSSLFTVYSGVALLPATIFAAAPFVSTSSVLQIERRP